MKGFEWARWAMAQPLAPGPRHVLLVLAWHADEEGVSWPSVDRLQALTGLSRASVLRHLSTLEEAGSLERGRMDDKRRGLYRLSPSSEGSHRETDSNSAGLTVRPIEHPQQVSPCDPSGLTVRPNGSHPATCSTGPKVGTPRERSANQPAGLPPGYAEAIKAYNRRLAKHVGGALEPEREALQECCRLQPLEVVLEAIERTRAAVPKRPHTYLLKICRDGLFEAPGDQDPLAGYQVLNGDTDDPLAGLGTVLNAADVFGPEADADKEESHAAP